MPPLGRSTTAETIGSIEIVDVPRQLALPAGPLPLGAHHHRILDCSKIRRQLQYRDVVPVDEALARTTRWYVEHPLEPGGEIEERLGDAFDYANEDELIGRLEVLVAELAAFRDRPRNFGGHPYPHPVEPGLSRDHRNR
jgi:hypothetical protein